MGGKRENEVGLDWLSVRCLWAMQVGHPFGLWIDESLELVRGMRLRFLEARGRHFWEEERLPVLMP